MWRVTGVLLLLTLLCLPAQAVGPLALLGKEIVKGIVRNFVENQMNQMLATAGPCGMPIAQPGALAGMAGLLRGRGGMPGVTNLPGGAAIPGGIPGAMPSLSDMKLPPGMAEKMQEQMAGQQGARGESPAASLSGPAMAKAMAALQDTTPLSTAEVDELGTLLERMAAAMPSAAPKCKPGEMKAVLAMAADSPMGGGMLRMMLEPLRDMQRKLDEAKDTFARMSEQERGEYVDSMAAEFGGWDKENRQALLGMVESNFLGMPDDMRAQLLARLKQER